jgi:hypothetical protein
MEDSLWQKVKLQAPPLRFASVGMTKGRGGASMGNWLSGRKNRQVSAVDPTQAKERLDPDFLPRCARELRVCAFH